MLTRLIPLAALVVAASCACFDNGDKEIGGNCFRFVNQKLSFNDARDWCHYKNPVTASFLASVPNQFTDNFLATYARSEFGTNDGFFWIGLSREKSYTPWMFDTGYQASWTNFVNGQLGQNYGAESIVNGKWQTFGEGEKMPFVCMYDPTAPPTFGPPVTGTTAAPTTAGTTQSVPTTTARPAPTQPPCSRPFRGKIALAYEMTQTKHTDKVVHFIQTYLYNSTNYRFDDATTQAINVPYPDSGLYENYILNYPDARSVETLDVNIDQLLSEAVDLKDAKIERAYEYIYEERDPGNDTTNVLITVGVDDIAAFDGSASYYLHRLQLKYGFRSIVVSIGKEENYLEKLAESPDWYFAATDSNGAWVADQISRIICHL